MQGGSDTYRPATPDSALASGLQPTSPIDDLTLALTNFSRVPSPELLQNLCCCCGEEDCETTKNWLALKSKLENRLILSAGESKAAWFVQHCHVLYRGRLCFVTETRGLRAAT